MDAAPHPLCVVFADVSGSTMLHEKLGDGEARRAIERCLGRIKRAAEAYRGRLIKTAGDDALMVFGGAEEGFLAACEMQQKIEALAPVSGNKLAIHVGLHCGDVIERQGDVFGDTVNTAARLVALAKAGQIITSDETVARLSPLCLASVRRLDSVSVKGKAESVQLWEALWRGNEDLTLVPNHSVPARPMEFKLCLRHGEQEVFLGEKRMAVTLGRDAGCDLVIRDPRASRIHARIEFRRDKFVLIDQSTNGTYIAAEVGGNYFVKREEAILRGSGRLSFGQPGKKDIPDFVDYTVME